MIETVLVLPLLAMILALVIYFGQGMVRVQHTQAAARYEAWRSPTAASGPAHDQPLGNPQINQAFFAGNAASVSVEAHGHFPDDAAQLLRDAGAAWSQSTGRLVRETQSDLPRGAAIDLSVEHAPTLSMLTEFSGAVVRRHVRIGHDWKFVNGFAPGAEAREPSHLHATNNYAIRDIFFPEFDQALANTAGDNGQSNSLAAFLRSMYLHDTGYRGPTILTSE